jgi:uncharacterized protein (UPF0305 family)
VIEENKFVQENFREDSQKSYIESFLYRVNDISKDNSDYSKNVDKKALSDAVGILKANRTKESFDNKIFLITYIASFYAAFLFGGINSSSRHSVSRILKIGRKRWKILLPGKGFK